MIIKHQQRTASHLTPFDLFGTNETGLSKAFAYVLAKEKDVLFVFLRFLGIYKRIPIETSALPLLKLKTSDQKDEQILRSSTQTYST